MATHGSFELGFSALIAPMTFADTVPSTTEVAQIQQLGLRDYFVQVAREVAILELFNDYYATGWNLRLAYRVRYKLAPVLIKTITLAWYAAAIEADS